MPVDSDDFHPASVGFWPIDDASQLTSHLKLQSGNETFPAGVEHLLRTDLREVDHVENETYQEHELRRPEPTEHFG